MALPPGRRVPDGGEAYWITTDPVPNLELLAPWLADRFVDSGLWPLLWRDDADPDDYGGPVEDLDHIDAVDLLAELQSSWEQRSHSPVADSTGPFPGLAAAQPGTAASVVPFPDWALSEPARLLLVPVNRPADTLAVLGGVSGEHSAQFISAMQRSWEQRFGAVIFEIAPGMSRLHVSRPPRDSDQALAVAAEIQACHITKAPLVNTPVHEIAHDLQYGDRDATAPLPAAQITRDCWDIIW